MNSTNQPEPDPAARSNIREWVAAHTDALFSWALYKTSSKETAEDLVQETFLAAVKGYQNFEGKSNPKTWLFAILNNKIIDHHRNVLRKIQMNTEDFDSKFDRLGRWKIEERPELWEKDGELLDNKEFRTVLEDCLNNLPSNWYSAVQLKYLEEKNWKIICQELGITQSNFWKIIQRAKLKLRECLELKWFKR